MYGDYTDPNIEGSKGDKLLRGTKLRVDVTYYEGEQGDYFQPETTGDIVTFTFNSFKQILIEGSYNTSILQFVDEESINSAYSAYNSSLVGASGAIYGVLVAFGMMYPNAELMLIFLPIPIKAKYFIPLIIMGDLFFGISGTATGVAHFAHIGGALFGFIMAYYWKKNSFDSHRWN